MRFHVFATKRLLRGRTFMSRSRKPTFLSEKMVEIAIYPRDYMSRMSIFWPAETYSHKKSGSRHSLTVHPARCPVIGWLRPGPLLRQSAACVSLLEVRRKTSLGCRRHYVQFLRVDGRGFGIRIKVCLTKLFLHFVRLSILQQCRENVVILVMH